VLDLAVGNTAGKNHGTGAAGNALLTQSVARLDRVEVVGSRSQRSPALSYELRSTRDED
jgi:hypothetical protein